MFKAIIVSVVAFSARRPWLVLGSAMLLAIASAVYVSDHFAINTDISKLISDKLDWRQREIAFGEAFPKEDTGIIAVIDGPTPEAAESAAERLVAKLNAERGKAGARTIANARLATANPFFKQNGLLYLTDEKLDETLSQLQRSSQFLGPLAADPSLRGIMNTVSQTITGPRARFVPLDRLASTFNGLAGGIEDVLRGQPSHFSWRSFAGETGRDDTRQIVEIKPWLDYQDLMPGQKAASVVRRAVSELKLPDEGVTVRLTGSVRISDEEFGTLEEGAALNGVLTVAAVLLILWAALHSVRIIFAVFVSLAAGLAVTAALGLWMAGAFNPISVAFFVLFVGIGVDFGLQFSVSYRAERYERENLYRALISTASNTGGRLALAAVATAVGFLSFLQTAYRGLSELGEIAGVGMLIAFFTSITILPALLRLLNPPSEPDPLGYSFLSPVDDFMERNRMRVLFGTIAGVLLLSPLLYWLQFDVNPMNLRSPKVESVATYYDLKKHEETRGGTAEVLASSLNEAEAIAKKVSALPEVAQVMTINSFVPDRQEEKLAKIKDAAQRILPSIAPEQKAPPPTDAEELQSIRETHAALTQAAERNNGTRGAQAAQRLATALSHLVDAGKDLRSRVSEALVTPLEITLRDLKESLQPQTITLASIPDDIKSNWLTPKEQARVSITPKEDTGTNAGLKRFVDAVERVEPSVTGEPVGLQKAGESILDAFIQAAALALVSIFILLLLTLRRLSDVLVTLLPLLLAGVVTLELCVIFGLKLNFANIIALPVLLGIGVAFKIYYVMAWREGRSGLLASPLTRAVFYSGMTTAVGFGSLWLSNHPGTSSMGELLALALVSTMAAAVLFQPLLMGPPREKKVKRVYLETAEHTF